VSLEIEARFGQPVDIEAAIARGTWYVLQARPITTGVAAGDAADAGAAIGATTVAPASAR
jgi:phosphoenolpyruvate synthase/pyruvate phosphate dikinase